MEVASADHRLFYNSYAALDDKLGTSRRSDGNACNRAVAHGGANHDVASPLDSCRRLYTMKTGRDGLPLNPMLTKDRMCRSKRAYRSIEEMKESLILRGVSVQLYAYKCPYGDHYHFTKHSRVIDPELQDRVNIPLVLEKEKP